MGFKHDIEHISFTLLDTIGSVDILRIDAIVLLKYKDSQHP